MAIPRKATAKKVAAKKVAAKKPAVKKVSAKRPAAKKVAGRIVKAAPPGWKRNEGGVVLVEEQLTSVALTPASKLRKGLSAAQTEIKETLQEFATLLALDFEVSEIELSISFSADGKFLGFGVGGATTIKVKIRPVEEGGDA